MTAAISKNVPASGSMSLPEGTVGAIEIDDALPGVMALAQHASVPSASCGNPTCVTCTAPAKEERASSKWRGAQINEMVCTSITTSAVTTSNTRACPDRQGHEGAVRHGFFLIGNSLAPIAARRVDDRQMTFEPRRARKSFDACDGGPVPKRRAQERQLPTDDPK